MSSILANCQERYLAFDIFDTLLQRAVTPEHVKMLASERLCRVLGLDSELSAIYERRRDIETELCHRSSKTHQELEFRFADLSAELLRALIADGVISSNYEEDRFRAAMLSCEIAAERSILKAVDPVIEALNEASGRGKQIILISDFYLSAADLTILIKPFGFFRHASRMFVSSDYIASKRSGRLYERVCSVLAAAPSEILMVGDNLHSDIAQARSAGLNAVHVHDPDRAEFYASDAASVVHRRTSIDALNAVLNRTTLSEDRNFRAILPALLLFSERLHALAARRGLTDICFLAREGQLLRSIFDHYQEHLNPAAAHRIRSHYVHISRRSAYPASLLPLDEEGFEGFFRMYRRLSVRDFLQSLGFTPADITLLANEIGVHADHIFDDFPESDSLMALRRSDAFRQRYEQHRLAQRTLLRAYISQFGIALDRHPLVLVDIGWKGSIQDYLRETLPTSIDIEGWYFGLLNIGQPMGKKTGLIFSDTPHRTEYFYTYTENRTLFELLLCADHPSALRYALDDDGKVIAVPDLDEQELEYIRKELLPLRADLLTGFKELCDVRFRSCLPSKDFAAYAAEQLADFVFRPWQTNGMRITNAQHRENFGRFMTSRYSGANRPTLRDRWRFCVGLVSDPRSTLGGSFWPAHTVYRHTNRFVTYLYGIRRRRADRRLLASALKSGELAS